MNEFQSPLHPSVMQYEAIFKFKRSSLDKRPEKIPKVAELGEKKGRQRE